MVESLQSKESDFHPIMRSFEDEHMGIANLFEVNAHSRGNPSFPNGLDNNIAVDLSFASDVDNDVLGLPLQGVTLLLFLLHPAHPLLSSLLHFLVYLLNLTHFLFQVYIRMWQVKLLKASLSCSWP